jgi:hypothetical protein
MALVEHKANTVADNVSFQAAVLATPAAGVSVATDDVGGAQYQRIKLDIGGDGVSSPITLSNPMPIGTLPGGTVIVSGTVQTLGSIQGVGTFQVLGSVQGVGTFQMLGTLQPLAGSVHIASGIPGTVQVLGSVQSVGTQQGLGTYQPLAGSVHIASTGTLPLGTVQVLGSVQPVGTTQALGTVQPLAGSVHIASTGTLPLGTVQVLGSVQTVGTSQALGTFQPLAGSVHIASTGTLPLGTVQVLGSIQTVGTSQVLGTVQTVGTRQVLGTIQAHGTTQALGTFQPLAGSVHIANSLVVTIGTISGGTIQAFGTTEVLGTVRALTAVDVTVGTIAEGTIQSFTGTAQVLGTVQVLTIPGTVQVLGSVQTVGTSQALGTFQPLAGSVHLATNLAGGTVVAVGSVAHGGVADLRPILFGGFGSSGTQAAVDDGDIVRAWFDLNGRLQMRGTIDSLPAVSVSAVAGTVQVLGSVQTVGTSQVLGSVQTVGTSQVLGSVQTVGTSQVLGSVQPVGTVQALGSISVQGLTPYLSGGGSANPVLGGGVSLAARPGTSTIGSVVRQWYDLHGRQVVQVGNGTTAVFGSYFTANGNGTLLGTVGAGSFVRIYDIVVSGSAAGTVRILSDATQVWGPLFLAANGGWNMNSAVGAKMAVNTALVVVNGMGSLSVTINYGVEGA